MVGLHVVYEPPLGEKRIVDIVFVHGFSKRGGRAWAASGGNTWIRDFLPVSLPSARIMIFNYDSTLDALLSTNSKTSLSETAQELILDLISKTEDEQRPLIFLCHALGGLIVKEAVVMWRSYEKQDTPEFGSLFHRGSFFHRIRAILFFATPHHGEREYRGWAEAASVAFGRNSSTLIRSRELVRTLNIHTEDLLADFTYLAQEIRIYSFYETRRSMPTGNLAVSQYSATLGLPNERTIAVDADHRSIVKFSSLSDPGFIRVASVLEDVLRDIQRDLELEAAPVSRQPLNRLPPQVVPEELKFNDAEEESRYFLHYKPVGSGGFGFVDIVKAVIKDGTAQLWESAPGSGRLEFYARKAVAVKENVPLHKLMDLRREAENLRNLKHRHMARLELVYQREDDKGKTHFVFITSPYADGDMRDFLEHKKKFAIDRSDRKYRQQLLQWFGCLTKAVEFLKIRTIRHMDIKPENILIIGDDVRLTDFGISKDMSGSFDGRTKGPLSVEKGEYFAPEVIQQQERGYESDLFSLGCVFLEMLTDFCGIDYSELHKKLEGSHSPSACNLCKKDPSRRGDGFAYHHHPVTTLQWLFSLVTKCLENDYWTNKDEPSTRRLRLAPLDWTFSMLQPDEKQRVKVNDLVKAICAVEKAQRSIAIALPADDALEVFICGECSKETVALGIRDDTGHSGKLSRGLRWEEGVVPQSWDEANAKLGWVESQEPGTSEAGLNTGQ